MTENLKRDNELIVEMIMNSILQIKGQNNHIQTNSPVDCLISPWGQSWERIFHKHKCMQFIAQGRR